VQTGYAGGLQWHEHENATVSDRRNRSVHLTCEVIHGTANDAFVLGYLDKLSLRVGLDLRAGSLRSGGKECEIPLLIEAEGMPRR
jgi:hypothetical protein